MLKILVSVPSNSPKNITKDFVMIETWLFSDRIGVTISFLTKYM